MMSRRTVFLICGNVTRLITARLRRMPSGPGAWVPQSCIIFMIDARVLPEPSGPMVAYQKADVSRNSGSRDGTGRRSGPARITLP
jgi:hypothetical protein